MHLLDVIVPWAFLIISVSICSICYDADNWELISKYSRRFVKAGVKLRKTTFDIWMEFASKRGSNVFYVGFFLRFLIMPLLHTSSAPKLLQHLTFLLVL